MKITPRLIRPLGRLVMAMTSGFIVPRRVRPWVLTRLGHDVHRTSTIESSTFIGAMTGLTVGPKAYINRGCFIDLVASVSIGPRTHIGPQVMILTSTHAARTAAGEVGSVGGNQVQIGADVWIGARAIILPGVSVADGVTIGAGSTVVSDCVAGLTYVGSPARPKSSHSLDVQPGPS